MDENKRSVLVTAIGSFSAGCVISSLKKNGFFVLGTDIYPKEWHNTAQQCDMFLQAPFATSVDYVSFILKTCINHNIGYIMPLTDLEIDILDENRQMFESSNVTLLTQETDVLKVARNKYILSQTFDDYEGIKTPPYILLSEIRKEIIKAPEDIIAKPINGRSSEGLFRIAKGEDLRFLRDKKEYIIQKSIPGQICTVDYVRNPKGDDVAISRKELIRTKNGAGVTVELFNDPKLREIVSLIGKKLEIIGCVNMEFILNKDLYYLIDINPRFSAGVAFSKLAGYDMIINHLRCYVNEDIDPQITYGSHILEKVYHEVINV